MQECYVQEWYVQDLSGLDIATVEHQHQPAGARIYPVLTPLPWYSRLIDFCACEADEAGADRSAAVNRPHLWRWFSGSNEKYVGKYQKATSIKILLETPDG